MQVAERRDTQTSVDADSKGPVVGRSRDSVERRGMLVAGRRVLQRAHWSAASALRRQPRLSPRQPAVTMPDVGSRMGPTMGRQSELHNDLTTNALMRLEVSIGR